MAGGLPLIDFSSVTGDLSEPREYFLALLEIAEKRSPGETKEMARKIREGELSFNDLIYESFNPLPAGGRGGGGRGGGGGLLRPDRTVHRREPPAGPGEGRGTLRRRRRQSRNGRRATAPSAAGNRRSARSATTRDPVTCSAISAALSGIIGGSDAPSAATRNSRPSPISRSKRTSGTASMSATNASATSRSSTFATARKRPIWMWRTSPRCTSICWPTTRVTTSPIRRSG